MLHLRARLFQAATDLVALALGRDHLVPLHHVSRRLLAVVGQRHVELTTEGHHVVAAVNGSAAVGDCVDDPFEFAFGSSHASRIPRTASSVKERR